MTATHDTGKPPKILCVDDESNVLAGLDLHLHRRYDLTTATSGAAALESLRSNTFAVVKGNVKLIVKNIEQEG